MSRTKAKHLDFKRGQLKIQEMAFMLIAVLLFFVLVGLFVFSIFFQNIQKNAESIKEDRTRSLLTYLAESPEFSCGKPNCIDGDKLMALIQRGSYKDYWQFSSLEVIKSTGLDKPADKLIRCNSENYPACDILQIVNKNQDEVVISSYVAICWKENENEIVYEKCDIGKIKAGTEKQNEE